VKGSVPERFVARVCICDSGCWEWTGSRNAKGYGRFAVTPRKIVLAHRYAFLAAYGCIGDEVCVLHRCDNPACVNPDHLFAGTKFDNYYDMRDKGRHVDPPRASGSAHPRAILSEAQVSEIRRRYEQRTISQKQLGRIYGVSESTIGAIIKRRIWRTVS